jgi:mannose/cellobiose epimerase-like protein (N-acyl-D-glucosamine 2-epimerase family)
MNDKAVIHAVKGADRTIREWEDLLRDVGDLSRTEAKIAAKAVVDALEKREVSEDFGGLIESIEKVKKVLTTTKLIQ